MTSLSPAVAWYSGTPLTTEVPLQTVDAPAYVYGRGDLGRTPQFFRADASLSHEFRPYRGKEDMRVRFELTVFNLFNSATAVNRDVGLIHPVDGFMQFDNTADIFKGFDTKDIMNQQNIRVNPNYNKANEFMGPRTLRLQVAFLF